MATYLRGVTDYVPRIQPFKPDLNFYQKTLEVKEGQYKAGYDKISNLYGTLLNSEMLRESDITKRDDFFKNVQNQIQRLSSVDLSLQENVSSAYTVFQPLIDDKNVTQDMAWTKRYRNEKGRGEYFRNCLDEKDCGGRWWKEGDMALDYLAADFSKSSDEEAFKFISPRYVPYVNPNEKGFDLIKELAPNVESVIQDSSGNSNYTMKNGEQLAKPLYHYLTGIIGNDASIKDVFDTKAYVGRKRYMDDHEQEYGSKEAAEANYLNTMSGVLRKEFAKDNKEVTEVLDYLNIENSALEEYFIKNGVNPEKDKGKLKKQLANQQQGQLLNMVKNYYKKAGDSVSAEIGDLDLETQRRRVDRAVSSSYLKNDMIGVATQYALTHSSVKKEANPFAMAAYQSKLRMRENAESGKMRLDAIALKHFLESGEGGESSQFDNVVLPGKVGNNAIDPNAPFSDVASATIKQVTGDVAKEASDFLKFQYLQLKEASQDPNNPARATQAATKMKDIFKGLLDDKGELKVDFMKSAEFFNETSPMYFKNVYDRALKAFEGDPEILFEDAQVRKHLSTGRDNVNKSMDLLTMTSDQIVKANQTTLKYIKDYAGDAEYAPYVDLIVKADGQTRAKNEFIAEAYKSANKSQYPTLEDFEEDGEELFTETATLFNKYMNNNVNPEMAKINVTGYVLAKGAAGGYGGIGGKAIEWNVDGNNPTSLGYRNTMEAAKDLNNAVAIKAGSDHTGKQVAEGDDPGMREFVNEFIMELKAGNYKKRGLKAPIGTITLQTVAGNNKDMLAYVIDVNSHYLDATNKIMKSTGAMVNAYGKASPLWNGTSWDTQVTGYIDKADLESDLAKTVLSPASYDELMVANGKPLVVQDAHGGTAKFQLVGDSYAVTGNLLFSDGKGNLYKKDLPMDLTNFAQTGLSDLRIMKDFAQTIINEASRSNQQSIKDYYNSQGSESYEAYKKKMFQ